MKEVNSMGDELLTFEEARKYLKVHQATLYNWVQQKKIPAFKAGKIWRFRKSKIDAWLEKQENVR